MSRHAAPIMVLAVVASTIAMFLTPADPISMFVVTVPVFLLMVSAYFIGRGRSEPPAVNEKPKKNDPDSG